MDYFTIPPRPWVGRGRMAVATALCAATLLGTAPAVAGTVVGTTDSLTVSTVDAQGQGSLTIIIAPHNPYDEVPAGQLPPGELAGTVFTAHRIASIDLSTQAGWAQAAAMTIDAARDADYSYVATATIDSDGRATFTGLPVGLYYVTATVPDDDHFFYRTPQDMLLTIPVGEKDQWQYNVVINAKYKPTTPTTPPTPPTTTPTVPVPTIPVVPPGGTPNDRAADVVDYPSGSPLQDHNRAGLVRN